MGSRRGFLFEMRLVVVLLCLATGKRTNALGVSLQDVSMVGVSEMGERIWCEQREAYAGSYIGAEESG